MPTAPKYFMYFPGNYRWSAAFVNMLGTAPFGGVDMSELHQIGRMLQGKSGDDDEAWFDACTTVADIVRVRAEKFRADNYPVAGGLSLLADGRALQDAEGSASAGCLSHSGRVLPSVRRGVGRENRNCRCPVRGQKVAGLFRAGAECEIRTTTVRRVLRWARHHQGNPISARRSRPGEARHFGAGDGRPGHRRGDPLPRHAAAPRL